MHRRRVWCETLALDALASPEVMGLAARFDLEVLAAIRPGDLDAIPRLLDAASHAGVRVGLWPMLDDADGRWLSTANAARFGDLVRAVLERARGRPLGEVAFDLEPPIDAVSRLVAQLRIPKLSGEGFDRARAQIAATVAEVRAQGVRASAIVVPMVLFDAGGAPWQRLLGTPLDGIPWDEVNAMAYTSIFEGWSRGALRRHDAVALLRAFCAEASRRHGARASASLGAVHTGALGDEPVYRDPRELREDVAVAVSAGLDDLTLFDLAGALRRPPVEAWLEAFTAPPDAIARPASWRAELLARACGAFGRLGNKPPA